VTLAVATTGGDRLRISRIAAAVIALGGVALLLTEGHMRALEANVAAIALRLTAVTHARPTGSTVAFVQGHHWVGYSIAAGCTAALLIAPFFFISAGLLLSRRVSIRRGLFALIVTSVLVWIVNQLRLLLIGESMRIWGSRTGYDRSHVLAGGVLSTFGVAVGVAIFVGLMVRDRPRPGAGGTHHRTDTAVTE
jgi:exosortase/archaeosortase family protein